MVIHSFLVGHMRLSANSERQSKDLQRDKLLSVGVNLRHSSMDHVFGEKSDRAGSAGLVVVPSSRSACRVKARPPQSLASNISGQANRTSAKVMQETMLPPLLTAARGISGLL